jgi:hypothetical protein
MVIKCKNGMVLYCFVCSVSCNGGWTETVCGVTVVNQRVVCGVGGGGGGGGSGVLTQCYQLLHNVPAAV